MSRNDFRNRLRQNASTLQEVYFALITHTASYSSKIFLKRRQLDHKFPVKTFRTSEYIPRLLSIRPKMPNWNFQKFPTSNGTAEFPKIRQSCNIYQNWLKSPTGNFCSIWIFPHRIYEILGLPPFSLIRDFGKQNTRGNVSKISVSLACYRQIGSKFTNHSHYSVTFRPSYVMLAGCDWWISIRSVDNMYDWRTFWKRFRGCFVFESRVPTKTVVMVYISDILQFPNFLVTFPGNSVPFVPVSTVFIQSQMTLVYRREN